MGLMFAHSILLNTLVQLIMMSWDGILTEQCMHCIDPLEEQLTLTALSLRQQYYTAMMNKYQQMQQ